MKRDPATGIYEPTVKIPRWIDCLRAIVTIALLFGVYRETGIWTTLSLFLIFVALEIQQWRSE